LHCLGSTLAILSIVIAPAGQISWQIPQPAHLSAFTLAKKVDGAQDICGIPDLLWDAANESRKVCPLVNGLSMNMLRFTPRLK
jgi:hypothetical protein